MTGLALPVVAAAVLALPPERAFWRPDPGPGTQPVEVRVETTLVAEGHAIAVYRENGYRFSDLGSDDEQQQITAAVESFDRVIYPRLVELVGPCPDLDANGKVLLVLTKLRGPTTLFWRFDQMEEETALQAGFHSNHGEIIYASFARRGNHVVWSIRELAGALSELLQYSTNPGATDWSRLLANYAPFACDLAGPRLLWGDDDPDGVMHRSSDPWTENGHSLLMLQYLQERLGDAVLTRLAHAGGDGFASLDQVVRDSGGSSAAEMAADAALASWLDDPLLANGSFDYRTVAPPRPLEAASVPASRPASGTLEVGVGGAVFMTIRGDDQRSQPLTLQGDPSVRWIGRGVHLRPRGPDEPIVVDFGVDGSAHVDLGALPKGDSAVIVAVPLPAATPTFDRRRLALLWGLGWVPRWPTDQSREALAELLTKQLPDGSTSARQEMASSIDRLCGLEPGPDGGEPLATRYAWAPEAQRVLPLLQAEAERRGLVATPFPFLRVTPSQVSQQWSNLVIELPGSDPRRWPVVVAAHWDGARRDLTDSYLHARNVHDNASGVVVALEAARAVAHSPHRAPVLVALLAGGYEGAAGAQALLDQLEGKVAVWIALDGVAIPEPFPRHLVVHLQADARLPQLTQALARALRSVGLDAQDDAQIWTGHSGVSQARAKGIAAVLLRTRIFEPDAPEADLPAEVERGYASTELMVLVARAVAAATLDLAGTP